MVEYFRGNLFANTPDILNEYLVNGGRPAFRIRLLLAATLLPLYGIYSGFELCENVPVAPGSEEYLDSEKYQLRPRNYDAPGNINADIQRINAHAARARGAAALCKPLVPHERESEHSVLPKSRRASRRSSGRRALPSPSRRPFKESPSASAFSRGDILVVVNTDPHHAQESMVHVPIHEMGLDDQQAYVVHDLLTGARYTWRGVRNYVRLDPAVEPGHVFLVVPEPTPARPIPPTDL